ncbi:MAG: hypothetical protein HQL98_13835 [Magnetococcales bacterium]|nr:hypothetical protein [Magnetococcales bacterium]
MNKIGVRMAVMMASFVLSGVAIAGHETSATGAAGQTVAAAADAKKSPQETGKGVTGAEAKQNTAKAGTEAPATGVAGQTVAAAVDGKGTPNEVGKAAAVTETKTTAMTDGKKAPQTAGKGVTVADAKDAKKNAQPDANQSKPDAAAKGEAKTKAPAPTGAKDGNARK